MKIEARISPGYRRKLALIGLLFCAFGVWAGYDVLVKYPPQLTRYSAYSEMVTRGNVENWPDYATKQGWPVEEPTRRVRGDFYFNGGLMLLIPIGLWFGLTSLLAGKRWVGADEHGLSTYRGQVAAWDKIETLNDRRWASKGIALVIYKDLEGRRRRIVLDEFNYQAQPIRQIHARVQEALGLTPETPETPDTPASDPEATAVDPPAAQE